mgnify:CR=1 FL=1
MKRCLIWGGGILASFLVAAFCMGAVMNSLFGMAAVKNGDWYTSLLAGDTGADPYSKAAVAVGGLLATRLQDSMYYRLTDIDGEPLKANCDYRLQGEELDANWWSVTAYGPNHFLMPNASDRYSFNNGNVQRKSDGSYVIRISRTPQPGNWLPIGEVRQPDSLLFGGEPQEFDLLLRLYVPGRVYLNQPAMAPLPRLVKEVCR